MWFCKKIMQDVENNRVVGGVDNFRKALGIVLVLHIFMFCVAFTAAIMGKSTAVMADAIDFIGDATNYTISLFIIGSSQLLRASVAMVKGITMIVFNLIVIVYTFIRVHEGGLPDPSIMSISGGLGILTHIICVYYLYKFRNGDSNQMSVWICTINDLISNVLTVLAAYLVLKTGSIVPDITAAFVIVTIAIFGALTILRQALKEIKESTLQNDIT